MSGLEVIKAKLGDRRVVIVSNREPYAHSLKVQEGIKIEETVGGLVSALNPTMLGLNRAMWIASGSTKEGFDISDNGKIMVPDEHGYMLKRIELTPEETKGHYDGFSNNILWPNCHLFSDKSIFSEDDWNMYKQVNLKFASAIVNEIGDDDLVWIQDYHLSLTPKYIRGECPNAKLAFFWHIPFPPYEIFIHLCTHWGIKILEGLLACDMIGFHTKNDVENFINTAERIIGAKKCEGGLEFNGKFIGVKEGN